MRRQGQGVVGVVRAVVAALVVVGVVGGCTGEPEPAPTSAAPSASQSPEQSPTPEPPPRPEVPKTPAVMAEPTSDGAAAAAVHFFDLYEYAFVTGDAEPFRRMSSDACTYCGEVVRQVQQAVDDQLLTERDPATISDVSVVEVRPAEWFTVDLRRKQGEIRLRGHDGSIVASEPPGEELHYGLALSWTDSRWTVDEVGITAAAE